MRNIDRIKQMTVDEMAKLLTELQCRECGAHDGYEWKKCQLVGCWCHPKNGYQSYGEWLLREEW